jgi:MoaA/NifB/PqqE/SkfB family radical SAM enzyme
MSRVAGYSLEIDAKAIEQHRITRLPVLVLHAHNRCNCRCVMCDIWKISESRSLTLADLEPHLASMHRLKVERIVFSGGEPLMNPALPELAGFLAGEGYKLTLLTTGLLLERYAHDIATSFEEVIVSLDGPPEKHDTVRRVNGAWKRCNDGIQAVRALRPDMKFSARCTVQRANHKNLQDTIETARQMGLTSISFLAADLTSPAFNRELLWPVERQEEVGLTLLEVKELECEIEAVIERYASEIASGFIAESPNKLRKIVRHYRAHLGMEAAEAPSCNAPWRSAVVETDGSVRPCFFHPAFGNVNENTLEDVVNGADALAFRSQLDVESNPTCRRCVCSLRLP